MTPGNLNVFFVDDTPGNRHIADSQDMQFFGIKEVQNKIVICPKDYIVNKEPIKHPGSESLYYVDMVLGKDRVMISYLPPNKLTSILHWHPGETILPRSMTPANSSSQKLVAVDYLKEVIEREGFGGEDSEVALPPLSEDYEILHGEALIHHSEDDKGYPVPSSYTVESFIRHRMEAGPRGAIFALVMRNAGLYPEELQHLHI
jgi:hypothetical protein